VRNTSVFVLYAIKKHRPRTIHALTYLYKLSYTATTGVIIPDALFYAISAHKFGEHYMLMFTDMEEAQLVLATLPTLVSPDDVNSNSVTGEFRFL